MVTITNPSDKPVHVQLLPLSDDSDAHAILPSFHSSSYFHLPAEATAGEIVPPHSRVELGPLNFSPMALEKGISNTPHHTTTPLVGPNSMLL